MDYISLTLAIVVIILAALTARFEHKDKKRSVYLTATISAILGVIALLVNLYQQNYYNNNRPFVNYNVTIMRGQGYRIDFLVNNYGATPIKDFEFSVIDIYTNDFLKALPTQGLDFLEPAFVEDLDTHIVASQCPTNINSNTRRRFYRGYIPEGLKSVKYTIQISSENCVYNQTIYFKYNEKIKSFDYERQDLLVDNELVNTQDYFTHAPETFFK